MCDYDPGSRRCSGIFFFPRQLTIIRAITCQRVPSSIGNHNDWKMVTPRRALFWDGHYSMVCRLKTSNFCVFSYLFGLGLYTKTLFLGYYAADQANSTKHKSQSNVEENLFFVTFEYILLKFLGLCMKCDSHYTALVSSCTLDREHRCTYS